MTTSAEPLYVAECGYTTAPCTHTIVIASPLYIVEILRVARYTSAAFPLPSHVEWRECDTFTSVELSAMILQLRYIDLLTTELNFQPVFREQNKVADALAKKALLSPRTITALTHVPTDLEILIHDDRIGANPRIATTSATVIWTGCPFWSCNVQLLASKFSTSYNPILRVPLSEVQSHHLPQRCHPHHPFVPGYELLLLGHVVPQHALGGAVVLVLWVVVLVPLGLAV
nr:hypothetical protein Iba_chr13fCG7200 [Ipomoea batatas]